MKIRLPAVIMGPPKEREHIQRNLENRSAGKVARAVRNRRRASSISGSAMIKKPLVACWAHWRDWGSPSAGPYVAYSRSKSWSHCGGIWRNSEYSVAGRPRIVRSSSSVKPAVFNRFSKLSPIVNGGCDFQRRRASLARASSISCADPFVCRFRRAERRSDRVREAHKDWVNSGAAVVIDVLFRGGAFWAN